MKKIIIFLLTLTLFVIGLGAFTRLMDAGLGCPDWPGCYGHWVLPSLEHMKEHVFDFDQGQELKAWIEMIHRYVAGTLGALIIGFGFTLVLQKRSVWLGVFLILLTVFQAALGMWTVTKKLNPIVVSGHLLGGMSLFLSLVIALSKQAGNTKSSLNLIKHRLLIDLTLAFYVLQVFLGAWVSTNYAALSCAHLFSCDLGHQMHFPSFAALFDLAGLWRSAEPLAFYTLEQKAHIQVIHRANAFLLGGFILALQQYCKPYAPMQLRPWFDMLLITYVAQVIIGLSLVLLQLPLPLAVVHNLFAAALGVPIFWIRFQKIGQHDAV